MKSGEKQNQKKRHLPSDLLNAAQNTGNIDIVKGTVHISNDSPGLKSARLNLRGVRNKVEVFEKEIVDRSKVRISPNKF